MGEILHPFRQAPDVLAGLVHTSQIEGPDDLSPETAQFRHFRPSQDYQRTSNYFCFSFIKVRWYSQTP